MNINYNWQNKNIKTSSTEDNVEFLISKIQQNKDSLDGLVFFQEAFQNYHINLKTSINDFVGLFNSYNDKQQQEIKRKMIEFIGE